MGQGSASNGEHGSSHPNVEKSHGPVGGGEDMGDQEAAPSPTPRTSAPAPQWRFVNTAKKSYGYSSQSAGRIVVGKSAQELVAEYAATGRRDVTSKVEREVEEASGQQQGETLEEATSSKGRAIGRLSIREGNDDIFEETFEYAGPVTTEKDVEHQPPAEDESTDVIDGVRAAAAQSKNGRDVDETETLKAEVECAELKGVPHQPQLENEPEAKDQIELPKNGDLKKFKRRRLWLFIATLAVILLGAIMGVTMNKSKSKRDDSAAQLTDSSISESDVPSAGPNESTCPENSSEFQVLSSARTGGDPNRGGASWVLRDACTGELIATCPHCRSSTSRTVGGSDENVRHLQADDGTMCLQDIIEYVFQVVEIEIERECCDFDPDSFALLYGGEVVVQRDADKSPTVLLALNQTSTPSSMPGNLRWNGEEINADDWLASSHSTSYSTYVDVEGDVAVEEVVSTFEPSLSPTPAPTPLSKMRFGQRSQPCTSEGPSSSPSIASSLPPTERPSPSPTTMPTAAEETDVTDQVIDEKASLPAEPTMSPETIEPSGTPSMSPVTKFPSKSPSKEPIITRPIPLRDPTESPSCNTNAEGDFALCIALDMSGSVCNNNTEFLCHNCQPAALCRQDEADIPYGMCCKNFRNVIKFTQQFVASISTTIASNQLYSLVGFSNTASWYTDLITPVEMVEVLETVIYTGGLTNHEDAIESCHISLDGSPDTKKMILLITDNIDIPFHVVFRFEDGMPSLPDTPLDAALKMASKVEREGTTIFPVMISSEGYSPTPNDVDYLEDLSSDNTFADVSDFFALYSLREKLASQIACGL